METRLVPLAAWGERPRNISSGRVSIEPPAVSTLKKPATTPMASRACTSRRVIVSPCHDARARGAIIAGAAAELEPKEIWHDGGPRPRKRKGHGRVQARCGTGGGPLPGHRAAAVPAAPDGRHLLPLADADSSPPRGHRGVRRRIRRPAATVAGGEPHRA